MGLPSSLAIHEAAHAVALWLQAIPVHQIILGDPKGHCLFSIDPDSPAFLVALLSGVAAEVLIFGRFEDSGAGGDMERATALASKLDPKNPVGIIDDFTRRWGPRLRAELPRIIRLAEALDSQGWLCGRDVQAILERGEHRPTRTATAAREATGRAR